MAEMMATDKLFEITRENLETGLRGYPVGYCITSSVDPNKGLSYVGHLVSDLVNWSPENVIYLLFEGHPGTDQEVEAFTADLRQRSPLSPAVINHIRQLPRQGQPMNLFAAALLILGMLEGTGDYRQDALNIAAKVPALTATVINYHAGWSQRQLARPDQGYIENFTHLLNPPTSDLEGLTSVFKLFNILHYDHGGGNLSAFTGKAVASGLEDLYGCLSAAMCALAGPRHGRANQDCLEQVQEFVDKLGAEASEEAIEGELRRRLAEQKLIFGFGHAVLRVEDPRATIFYKYGEEHFNDNPLIKLSLNLRKVGTKVLRENNKVADPYPNVDAISGSVLAAAGFPYPEYFPLLFGMARVVGISRQIVYERCEAREGKGVPIYRPKFFFRQG